jgi:hypothetical protein
MASIRSALTIAVLFIWIAHSESACPSDKFIPKHVCSGCKNAQDALNFSLKRKDTDRNTVFVAAAGVTYTKFMGPKEELCKNNQKVVTYQCSNLKANANAQPYCIQIGICQGSHATSNGHLDYNNLSC